MTTAEIPKPNGKRKVDAATLEMIHQLDRKTLFELGRALRKGTPRTSHADWDAATATRDPVTLLEESNATRVPDLVPVRYGRMLVSAFTYLRGSPATMASDLARTPVSGINVQLCGDAHLSNFGFYGSPERRLVFDLNDFDETLPGPFEWDVKRLAVSVLVAAEAVGIDEKTATKAARETVQLYRETMATMARMTPLEVWYSHIDSEQIVAGARNATARRFARSAASKARSRDGMQALAKLTTVVDGHRRIVEDPPIVERDPGGSRVMSQLAELFDNYTRSLQHDRLTLLARYRFVDAARKVVGVGSVGTRCWIVLSASIVDDTPLWLQLKEAGPSVLAPNLQPSEFQNHGERVVAGQRLMQTVSDIFLGWSKTTDYEFYIRQLRDMKGGVDLMRINGGELVAYSRLCGLTLARAHARSGPAAAIAGYLGTTDTFDRAVTQFAVSYANQNRRDYSALVEAEQSGRIQVIRGR